MLRMHAVRRIFLGIAAFLTFAAPALALPDLDISNVTLDTENRLLITLTNDDLDPVPAGAGAVSIFIDGRPVAGYRLGLLSDQSFRTYRGSTTLVSNVRLAGAPRRVGVVVDPHGEIAESNEIHNSHTRTLTPTALRGHDLAVISLFRVGGGQLWVFLRNQGPDTTPVGHTASLAINVDGRVVRTLSVDGGGLAAGAGRWIAPSPAIELPTRHRVIAMLNTGHFNADLDSVNNVAEAWLPESPTMLEFDLLIAMPAIRNAIVWRGATDQPYASWSGVQRAELRAAVSHLESGQVAGLAAMPSIVVGTAGISESDARRIYIARIAQSLWVEARHLVPWSLLDLRPEQRSLLFDSAYLVTRLPPSLGGYVFTGSVTDWSPEAGWQFLSNLRLLKSTQHGTVYALAAWMQGHFIHTSTDTPPWTTIYGYAGYPPADRMLYPLDGQRHWTPGCHSTAPLFRAVLHSVNIPVAMNTIDDSHGHRRPILPSLDLAMVHADDVHTLPMKNSGNPVSIAYAFNSLAYIEARYLNPPRDCDALGCSTAYQQWSYNHSRDLWDAAIRHLGDALLGKYALGGPAELDRWLSSDPGEFIRPLYTEAERTGVRVLVENELRRIGDGNLASGIDRVLHRTNVWSANSRGD